MREEITVDEVKDAIWKAREIYSYDKSMVQKLDRAIEWIDDFGTLQQDLKDAALRVLEMQRQTTKGVTELRKASNELGKMAVMLANYTNDY